MTHRGTEKLTHESSIGQGHTGTVECSRSVPRRVVGQTMTHRGTEKLTHESSVGQGHTGTVECSRSVPRRVVGQTTTMPLLREDERRF